MAEVARDAGVQVLESTPVREVDEHPYGVSIIHSQGRVEVEQVVVSIGVWVGHLLPEIGANVSVTHQEIVLIEPRDCRLFAHGVFPVWSIDPDEEGWYGFPLLREGYIKISKEPLGDTVDPDTNRVGTEEFTNEARIFLRRRIPEMADGTVVDRRSCLYTVTPDDHFIVDCVPGRNRVFIAGGGSGHGFKFGGSIGPIIADVMEDAHNPLGDHFRIGHRFDIARESPPGNSRGFARPATDIYSE